MVSPKRLVLTAALSLALGAPNGFAQSITEFPVGNFGTPFRITPGPDGALWFTTFADGVARITTAEVVTYFDFPGVFMAVDIATGSDGNLWFTFGNPDDAFPNSGVSRVTPAGVLTVFPLPDDRSLPWGIIGGQDGALWFTERTGNRIGRLTTSGVLTEFPLPTPGSAPTAIAAGPDGALWFTETGGNRIGRMTTDGVITEFSIPTSASQPMGISSGPDGNLWFTERAANKIGRITTEGTITEFAIPTLGSGPVDIVAGPFGSLWFTERDANQIGRVTTAGAFTELPVPTPASSPEGIAVGPDSSVWFTEALADKIGRVQIGDPPPPPAQRRILPVVGSTPGSGGTFFRTSLQLHNAGTWPASGRIVFHRSGASGSDNDVAISYLIAAGGTESIPDLLPAMGLTGIGSADIMIASGTVPTVTARVFNDAGASGTTGFTTAAMRPEEALGTGQQGVLFVPADLANYRLNIGVRTLAATLITFTVRTATGSIAATIPRFFPATYHEQQAAGAFLNGLPLPAGGSITATVEAGNVIVYGATVDNRTGDPSLQIAAPAP